MTNGKKCLMRENAEYKENKITKQTSNKNPRATKRKSTQTKSGSIFIVQMLGNIPVKKSLQPPCDKMHFIAS